MGAKSKALVRNVTEIKKMVWYLLNQDCVTFFSYLTLLRTNETLDSFSIFKYCDQQTNKRIERLSLLAKERIYIFGRKELFKDSDINSKTTDKSKKAKKNKSGNSEKKTLMEVDYGKLYLEHYKKWMWY